jgi:hypothetical protein
MQYGVYDKIQVHHKSPLEIPGYSRAELEGFKFQYLILGTVLWKEDRIIESNI